MISSSEELEVHAKEFLAVDQSFSEKLKIPDPYKDENVLHFHRYLYDKHNINALNASQYSINIRKPRTKKEKKVDISPLLLKPHHVKTNSLSSNKNGKRIIISVLIIIIYQ